jgi:hypothetical protein
MRDNVTQVSDADELWIDTQSGTYGKATDLRIVADMPFDKEDDGISDGDIARYGETYGYSLEAIRTDAYEQGETAGQEYESPEVTNELEAHSALRDAVSDLLLSLDIDGTCQLCEMSYHFHSTDCVIHPVNNALDRMEY